jgi:hypothetical protein
MSSSHARDWENLGGKTTEVSNRSMQRIVYVETRGKPHRYNRGFFVGMFSL